MTKSKKGIALTIIAVLLEYAVLIGIVMFQQNFLMSFPLLSRMVITIIAQWMLLIVPIVIMILSKETLSDYGFSKDKIRFQIFTGLVIGVVMSLVIVALPMFLGYKNFFGSCQYSQVWQFCYEFIYKVFGVALAEEFFYRGFLFKRLLNINSSKWFAIILSSVIFGLSHIFIGNIIQVIVTTILALIWCICRDKIKNCTILSLIIAHGIYDFLITLFLLIL